MMSNVSSILLALLGFTIFSTGIVLTKAGSSWLKWPGKRNRAFYKSLAIWLIGFLLYNLAAIPNAIASRILPPHIIAAVSGWGIPVIVVLSYFILKEKLYKSDYIFSGILVCSIFALSILDQSASAVNINQTSFYIMLLLPYPLLLLSLVKGISAKLKVVLLALFAGCAGGFALVIMNVVVKSHGYDIFSYFDTPYPYLYVLSGIMQFIALQIAMRRGQMILVGPLQNSLMILYPVACSIFIFSARINIFQFMLIALIVCSCAAILRKH